MNPIKIRSRHPSHRKLEQLIVSEIKNGNLLQKCNLNLKKDRIILRFGSLTPTNKILTKCFNGEVLIKNRNIIEFNTIESIKISSNKRLMKKAFVDANIKTSDYFDLENKSIDDVKNWLNNYEDQFFILKNIFGSRNQGNTLFKTKKELIDCLSNKNYQNYIIEKYYNYNREYRLHISENGCFYACRKMLKSDIPEDKRWFRNDSNCVWVLEENPLFDKPENWNLIVEDCVKALKQIGLTYGAFDIRVQSSKNSDGNKRKVINYIIIESNSAPSFGDITTQKYYEETIKLINKKKTV
jgi:hypothetical protein